MITCYLGTQIKGARIGGIRRLSWKISAALTVLAAFGLALKIASCDLRTVLTIPRSISSCDTDAYATSCVHARIDSNHGFCLLNQLCNEAFLENAVYCGQQRIQQTNKSTLKTEALLCGPQFLHFTGRWVGSTLFSHGSFRCVNYGAIQLRVWSSFLSASQGTPPWKSFERITRIQEAKISPKRPRTSPKEQHPDSF